MKILSKYERLATALQSMVRGWMGRRRAKQLRKEKDRRAVVKIQAGTFCVGKGSTAIQTIECVFGKGSSS